MPTELDPTDEPTGEQVDEQPDPQPAEPDIDLSAGTTEPVWSDEELSRAFGDDDPSGGDDGSGDDPSGGDPSGENVQPDPSATATTQPDPATTEPDPTEPDPTQSPSAASDDTIEIGGQLYRRADVEAQLAWASSLTADQVQAIASVLDPRATQSTAPTEPTEPTPAAPAYDPEDSIDPQLARYVNDRLAAQQAEIEQLAAYREQSLQSQQSQRIAELTDGYNTARAQLAERYGFDDNDMTALETRMEQTGIVGTYAAQIPDPVQMFTQAYEDTLWTTPEFRSQMITHQAQVEAAEQARITEEQARIEREARARNASKLAGGGGSAPRTQPPPDLSTSEARRDAFTQGIAAALRGD